MNSIKRLPRKIIKDSSKNKTRLRELIVWRLLFFVDLGVLNLKTEMNQAYKYDNNLQQKQKHEMNKIRAMKNNQREEIGQYEIRM